MGIASLVIGILALILGFIPFCGYIALLPALVGIGLGVADIMQKNKAKESGATTESPVMGIIGAALNGVAVLIIGVWTIFFAQAVKEAANDPEFKDAMKQLGNAFDSLKTAETALEPEKLTRANFNKLKKGMTLAEVESVIGKTKFNATGEDDNEAGEARIWKGSGFKVITVVFVNGKVTELSQLGLE
jgi:hypothetical protein